MPLMPSRIGHVPSINQCEGPCLFQLLYHLFPGRSTCPTLHVVRPAISGGGDRPGLRRTNCSHLFSYQQTIRLPAAETILKKLEGLITTHSSSRGEDTPSWTSALSFLHSPGFSAIHCLFQKKSLRMTWIKC